MSGAGDGHHQPELRGPSRSSCFRICTIQQRQSPGGLMSGLESHLSHLVHAVYKAEYLKHVIQQGAHKLLKCLTGAMNVKGTRSAEDSSFAS